MPDVPALEFQSVSKSFGGADPVVRDVDLSVRPGEFLTLLGASGCGKTTMLRMMAGFEMATAGRIRIAGEDVTRTPSYKRNVGMVFQNLALFPHLSIFDNVAFGLKRHRPSRRELRAKVDAMLETVGLDGYQSRAISQLSGGQRQRVALARSLITEPAVLLLDEPLSALDLSLRRRMQTELKTIQARSGATFVFVTHDQEEAMSMSDRIAVIRAGRIAQIERPEVVYRTPADDFVASTLGEAYLFEAARDGAEARIAEFDATLPLPEGWQGGEPALMLRPEHLKVAPESCDFSRPAVIELSEFAGPEVIWKLRCADRTLTARGPFRPDSGLVAGAEVVVGWNRADAVLVPRTL